MFNPKEGNERGTEEQKTHYMQKTKSKEDHINSIKYVFVKRCSTSLVIKGMQIKPQ